MGHVLGGIQWTLLSNSTRAFNESAVVGNGVAVGNNSSTNSSQTSDSGDGGNSTEDNSA